ncbi:hypothetical protein B296_00004677 [Ensete ventricosum]|uniref:Uncharacterized protein n=1 Tax=Ensete ventricosum TaxID=4639 RepID=A0A426Z0T0_ENSVE|nr:hypothetical protein B296_00004677 [Ensete ventricosum]
MVGGPFRVIRTRSHSSLFGPARGSATQKQCVDNIVQAMLALAKWKKGDDIAKMAVTRKKQRWDRWQRSLERTAKAVSYGERQRW